MTVELPSVTLKRRASHLLIHNTFRFRCRLVSHDHVVVWINAADSRRVECEPEARTAYRCRCIPIPMLTLDCCHQRRT
jgi:hypothetical protein